MFLLKKAYLDPKFVNKRAIKLSNLDQRVVGVGDDGGEVGEGDDGGEGDEGDREAQFADPLKYLKKTINIVYRSDYV